MKTPLRVLSLLLLGVTPGCSTSAPEPPGYDGALPSPAARRALAALAGQPISLAGTLVGEFTLGDFAVVPNPVTGKGPVVVLRRPGCADGAGPVFGAQGEGGVWYLPVLGDGDAADLVRRATGAPPAELGGETSAPYREAVGER